MPHVNGSSDGDDLGDADEIKVFKHDEECEEEKKLIAEERQSDSLTEDKSSLVTEGESQVIFFFYIHLMCGMYIPTGKFFRLEPPSSHKNLLLLSFVYITIQCVCVCSP